MLASGGLSSCAVHRTADGEFADFGELTDEDVQEVITVFKVLRKAS